MKAADDFYLLDENGEPELSFNAWCEDQRRRIHEELEAELARGHATAAERAAAMQRVDEWLNGLFESDRAQLEAREAVKH